MNKAKRIEEHFVYLFCLVLFLLGALLVVASYKTQNVTISQILLTFGLALWPTAMVAFVIEFYLQRRWSEQIRRALHTDLTLVANQLGITRIYRDRGEWSEGCLALYQAAKKVRYLAVAPNIKGDGEVMTKTVLSLLESGTSFEFLICHPDNPFATQYYGFKSDDTGMTPFKRAIVESIERIRTLKSRSKQKRGKVDYKIYKGSPLCYLQIIDNVVFFQPYLYGVMGQSPIMIKFEHGRQRDMLISHFNKIWEYALTPEEFEREEARLETETGQLGEGV